MKRLVVAFGVALFISGLCASARARVDPGDGPPFDLVIGTGVFTYGLGDVPITVSARQTLSGPEGHFTVDDVDGHFEMAVNCLSVSGNKAVVGGEIVVGPSIYIGAGYLLLVIDSGTRSPDPDTVQLARVPTPPDPAYCDLGGGIPSTGGNFIVHDAS
jgi:hypothetical protein